MEHSLHFEIKPVGPVSRLFLAHQIETFEAAGWFVRQLPYRRNAHKADLTTVFTDRCGTCSTKHALLKQLADEHGITALRLMLGIFRMDAFNTPAVAAVLQAHNLSYLPEAHNYLRWKNRILDFTTRTSGEARFEPALMEETEIQPGQIGVFKAQYHRQYLLQWLSRQPALKLTPEALWDIREACIAALSGR